MLIALVEPSRTVRRIISAMVEPWGHRAVCFDDPVEGLAHLERDRGTRGLITSTELPGTSGLCLIREARKLAGMSRPLYIILMSSSDERAKMVAALDLGADDFISKPPQTEELRARLRAADRITSMQAELAQLAMTDSLTGLLTRRAFVEESQRMLKDASEDNPISILICDIDRFKTINDTYGHGVGDRVLKETSFALKSFGAPVGRLGGEEFAILLPKGLDQAIEFAERARAAVASILVDAGLSSVALTCSIGVAERGPFETLDAVLRRSDVALYEAKRSGRNKVVAADNFQLTAEHDRWLGVARHSWRGAENG